MSGRQPVKIKLYGREYSIKSIQDPKDALDYAAYIDLRIRKIAKQSGSLDTNYIMALTLLQITHEFFTLRKQTESDADEYERVMDKLLEKVRSFKDKYAKLVEERDRLLMERGAVRKVADGRAGQPVDITRKERNAKT